MKRRVARLILITGIIVSVALFAAVLWLLRSRDTGGADAGTASDVAGGGVVLAAGKDGTADSGQLLLIVPGNQGYGIITIPPRTVVDIPGHGFQAVGKALELGGEPLLRQSVANLVGLTVDHHIFFDQGAIDIAAGEAGTINFRTDRPLSTADGAVSLVAGDNPAGSTRALSILKASLADGPAGPRIQALFYEGLRAALSARPEEDRRSLAGRLAGGMASDLESSALADMFMDMTTPGRTVAMQPLPVKMAGSGSSWYLEPLPGQIEALLFGAAGATPVALEIRNGTGQAGVVEAAATRLAALNFTITVQAETSGVEYDYTQIRCGSEALGAAERVRGLLGKGTLIKDEYLEKQQIIVIMGRDLSLAELEKQ